MFISLSLEVIWDEGDEGGWVEEGKCFPKIKGQVL